MQKSGMAQEHWFDVFSKAAVHATTRRGVARSAAVLLPSLLLSGEAGVTADKKKGAKKKGGKKSGKKEKGNKGTGNQGSPDQGNGAAQPEQMGPPRPPQADDLCLLVSAPEPWPSDCRRVREQCQAPEEFCIYRHHENNVEYDYADCCSSLEWCCPDGCFDLRIDRDHCGHCDEPCGPYEVCRAGNCVPICRDQICVLGGEVCLTGNDQRCHGQPISDDCQCGCGAGRSPCNTHLGWVCAPENYTNCLNR